MGVCRRYQLFLILTVLLFVGMTALSAGTRSAEGTGKTLEEAKLVAQLELASQLSIKVSSQQKFMASEYISSNKTTSEEFLYQNTDIQVNLELLGVQYKDQHTGRNGIAVTAYIDESSLPLYVQKLTTIKRNIDEIEQRNTEQVGLDTKKSNLSLLLQYYEKFEKYSTIARGLHNDVALPQLQKTKAGAELDYLEVLNTEAKLLQTDLNELQDGSGTSISSTAARQDAKIKMQEISAKIEANQRTMQALEIEQKEQQQELLKLTNASIQKSVQAMSAKAEKIKATIVEKPLGNDPLEFIRQIEEKKQAYQKITTDLESAIIRQSNPIQTRYAEAILELESAPYRTAEMVGGIPIDEAKKVRNQKITMLETKRDDELAGIRTRLERSVEKQQQDLLEDLYAEYKNLEKMKFTIKTLQYGVSLKVGTYDGYRKSWPVAVRFAILGKQFAYDSYISYEQMTSLELPNFSVQTKIEDNAYSTYLDQVDLFEAYFSSTKTPILVDISYRISPSSDFSEYVIILSSVNLVRSDNGKVFYSYPEAYLIYDFKSYMYTPKTYIKNVIEYLSGMKIKTYTSENENKQGQVVVEKKRNSKKDEKKTRFRDGFYGNVGMAFFPSGPVNGLNVSISGCYTPIKNVYIGLALDGTYIPGETVWNPSYRSVGIYPLIGVVFQFRCSDNEEGVKGFGDVRFGFTKSGTLITILNIGMTLVPPLESSVKFQLSGEGAGMVCCTVSLHITGMIDEYF